MSAPDQAAPELLPCPFCGGGMEDRGYGAVHIDGGKCPIADLAIDLARWNRRADIAAPSAPAEVEGLVSDHPLIWVWTKMDDPSRRILAGLDAFPMAVPYVPLDANAAHEALSTALTALQADNERLEAIAWQLADALHTADTIIADYTDIADEDEQQEIDNAIAAHAKLKGNV